MEVLLSTNEYPRCLVTGANGFVGKGLTRVLENQYPVRLVIKGNNHFCPTECSLKITNISGKPNWQKALAGQEVVIHLANRAHVLDERSVNPLAEYRKVNVEGTLELARQAVAAGVKRFIYLSSIKVNGEENQNGIFQYDDSPNPQDDYAISKWEAEQGLKEICRRSKMDLVIIRPPLVYGSSVKGNLRALQNVIDKGWPLPLSGIYNQRDLISVDNLVDLIVTCITHPHAVGQTFLCSDERSVSTTELIQRIANARHRKARLFWMPQTLIKASALCFGKGGAYKRLFGDLRVDITHTKEILGWSPPYRFEDEIYKAFTLETAGKSGDRN